MSNEYDQKTTYTHQDIADLYLSICKDLKDLYNSNESESSEPAEIDQLNTQMISEIIRENIPFCPEKFLANQKKREKKLHSKAESLPSVHHESKTEKENILVRVAGSQRSIPKPILKAAKNMLRQKSLKMSKHVFNMQQKEDKAINESRNGKSRLNRTKNKFTVPFQNKTAIPELTESNEESKRAINMEEKKIRKHALVAQLLQHTNFSSKSLYALSNEFKKIASESGEIDVDHFRKILKSHIREILTNIHHIGEDAQILTNAADAISNTDYIINRLYSAFDTDGNGSIDFREFIIGLNRFIHGSAEEKLDTLFTLYDDDQSGSISISELSNLLHGTNEKISELARYVNDCFSKFDKDGNNTITEDEFVSVVMDDPLALTSIIHSVPSHHNEFFTIRKLLGELSKRICLDWQTLKKLYLKLCEVALSKEDQTASKSVEEINLNISQFQGCILSFFKDHLESDEKFIAQIFHLFTVDFDDSKQQVDLLNCHAFVKELASTIHTALMGVQHDKARALFYFQFYDQDKDGLLSKKEICSVLSDWNNEEGIHVAKLCDILAEFDVDNDGHLTKDEYLKAAKKYPFILASIYAYEHILYIIEIQMEQDYILKSTSKNDSIKGKSTQNFKPNHASERFEVLVSRA